MKAYLIASGCLFGLLAAIHIFVVIERWKALAADPWPVIVLVISGVLCFWAWRVLRTSVRS